MIALLFKIITLQNNPNDKYMYEDEYKTPTSENMFLYIPWYEDKSKILVFSVVLVILIVLVWLTYTTEKAKLKKASKTFYTEKQLEFQKEIFLSADRINFEKQTQTSNKKFMDLNQELPEFINNSYRYIDEKVSDIYLKFSNALITLDVFDSDIATISNSLLTLTNRHLERVDEIAITQAEIDKDSAYSEYGTFESLSELYIQYVKDKSYPKFNALRISTLKNLCGE